MTGVFREVTIAWGDKDYTVTPSNKLLRRIEGAGDISIPAMAFAFGQKKPRMSEAAFVIAELLKAAGATVNEDEVFQELITGDQAQVEALIVSLFNAIMPQERIKKNVEQDGPRKKMKK